MSVQLLIPAHLKRATGRAIRRGQIPKPKARYLFCRTSRQPIKRNDPPYREPSPRTYVYFPPECFTPGMADVVEFQRQMNEMMEQITGGLSRCLMTEPRIRKTGQ